MTKVLVSGGNGYLGSVLVRSLVERGAEVHGLVHRNKDRLDKLLPPSNIHLDARNTVATEKLTAELSPDVIFHLAGSQVEPATMDDAEKMIQSNLTLGIALLRGATANGRQPIFINTGSYWQFSEEESFSPNSFYAATKQAFMDILYFFERVKGLRSTTLILYDTFGADDPRPKIWTHILNAPPRSRIALTEGRQLIDLVHVSDVASAFISAAELITKGRHLDRFYAIRSERLTALKTIVESLSQLTGKQLELDWGAIPYKPNQIFKPWQGPLLPGWHAKTDIASFASNYLQSSKAPFGKD